MIAGFDWVSRGVMLTTYKCQVKYSTTVNGQRLTVNANKRTNMKAMTHNQPVTFRTIAGQFFRDVINVLLKPGRFFEAMPEEKDQHAIITFLFISALLYSLLATFFVYERHLLFLFLFFLNGFLMPLGLAALLHLLLRLFKSERAGFDRLLGITAYANAALLFAWIPGMAVLVELFKYYLIGVGLVRAARVGALKAFLLLLGAVAVLLAVVSVIQRGILS